MRRILAIWLILCAELYAQRPPSPTDLAGHPFFITKTWVVGGVGDWDFLTIDPIARQLFIAHGAAVQVIDVSTGTLAGTVNGFRQAHAVVLDQEGVIGYVTDGPAGEVKVFDRRTLQVVAQIPTGPAPRAAALDAQTSLLFVIGSQPPPARTGSANDLRTGANATPRPGTANPVSVVTVIDTEERKQLAEITITGSLGFAQSDGNGQVYVAVSDRNQILRLDAQTISTALRQINAPQDRSQHAPTPERTSDGALLLDWTNDARPSIQPAARPRVFSLGSDCTGPRALAVDSSHQRIFVACANMKMAVLNGDSGQVVASVPIGAGSEGVAYDPDRGLIFSANGGGDGSLTIIRQDVTDSYAVVQILPTRQRARTLAVNSSNGEVYLATIIYGAPLSRPPVSSVPLRVSAVDSSFQVLVVGN
jgi:YVTN family beta-propeller protein